MGLDRIKWYSATQRDYVKSYLDALLHRRADRLVSVAIFGSMANGENGAGSDCDLFIVVNNAQDKKEIKMQLNATETGLVALELAMLDSGVGMFVSPLVLTKTEASSFNPLYLDMTTACLVLHDNGLFLKTILARTQEKMRRWGSTRHRMGNHWYWDIKPDNQWGDVIDYDQ